MLIGTVTRPRAPGGLWVVVSPQWRAVCLEGGYLQVMGCVVTEQARAFLSCQPRDEAPALVQMVGAMSCLHLSGPQLRGSLRRALQVPSLSCPHEDWVYSGMMARGGQGRVCIKKINCGCWFENNPEERGWRWGRLWAEGRARGPALWLWG